VCVCVCVCMCVCVCVCVCAHIIKHSSTSTYRRQDAILPYLFFFSCFNAGLLLRASDIQDAFYNTDEYGQQVIVLTQRPLQSNVSGKASSDVQVRLQLSDFREPGQVALRVVLDVCVFVFMVAWLSFKAWQDNKFLSATLDVNQDLSISWLEFSMYIYRNIGSILNFFIVLLLVTAGCVGHPCLCLYLHLSLYLSIYLHDIYTHIT
jgi:hypothetical protein